MSTEQIRKFQPDRTLSLRGFTGFGAAASLCETSADSFKVNGVFRDQADFCVLVVYDADNLYEHYTVKYLPDFTVAGLVLNFDLSYRNLQSIDSAKYSWIDWAQMDFVRPGGEPVQVRLWDHATLAAGNYSVAQATVNFTAAGGCTQYDRLTLFVNNASFDFLAGGGESAAYVAATFANSINGYDWSQFLASSVAVIASSDANGSLTLKNARTGLVDVDGQTVTYRSGTMFPGIAAGSIIYLHGVAATVAAVTAPGTLTLTSAAASGTSVPYLAENGGADGNGITAYFVVRPGNVTLQVDNPTVRFSGGNSDDVTWRVSLDFAALGLPEIRQAWLTFAPRLAVDSLYADSEWTATFSNWTVSDAGNTSLLPCAGPGSVRVGNGDPACSYHGAGWQAIAANNYWRGCGRTTSELGDAVTVEYTSTNTHDLYLGTSLFGNRAIVAATLDGDPATLHDCFLNTGSEVVTRRLLRRGVAAGVHTVTITLTGAYVAASGKNWDVSSTGTHFVFDYIEAAVPTDIPAPLVQYDTVSPALDYDTDATYKVSPQRLLWHLEKLGLTGHMNEYLGVYWWNQRKRVNAQWNQATVTFGGRFAPGDSATITLGTFTMQKAITQWDTLDSIASHFVFYINVASISMWAENTGAGQLTIRTRTPNWGDTRSASCVSAQGTVTIEGSTEKGVDGEWQIDPTSASPLNFAAAQWHADLFKAVAAQGWAVTAAFSMELVNPPDDGTVVNAWKARFGDGTAVETATDFQGLFSSQCAPIDNLTNYQKAAYAQVAGLQNAAGLTPWLQFGEFVWWYFNSSPKVPLGYVAYTTPISIGVAAPHGLTTGETVIIADVAGMTSANGTWTITVTDATHFTLDGSFANAEWTSGSGTMCYRSMGYYDAVTAAAAQAALGRPLHRFADQDDDPGVNGFADVNFLAARLKAHVDAIRSAVLAVAPNAKFELLYPDDVNNAVAYRAANLAAQGGRLNAAVNLPAAWKTKEGSGLDRLKVEALSWGATYRNLDLAKQAAAFALSGAQSWPASDVAYLIPWFNGACPWQIEFRSAARLGLGLINFWAYDHLAMMSWPIPFPSPTRRSAYLG